MRDVDGGRAWIVFVAAFCSQFLNGMISYGSGIIHVALLEHFQDSVAETAFVSSVFANLLGLLGPVGSICINLTSCRVSLLLGGTLVTVGMVTSYFASNLGVLLLTYGIIAGSGFGITTTTCVVVLGYVFEKYRSVMVGISVAAQGLGMLVCGPVFQYLIDTFGLKGTFLLTGGITSHFYVFGAVMKPSEIEEIHQQQRKLKRNSSSGDIIKRFLHFDVFKNFCFCFILLSALFVGLPYGLVIIHLPTYSITQGYTHYEAAYLLLYFGIGSTINRILTGLASGEGGVDVMLMYFGAVTIAGVTTVLFPLMSTLYIGQCLFSFVFGMYSGTFISIMNPLCVEIVGLDQLPTAVGLFFCSLGLGGLAGPPLAGLIVDNGGTYETSFLIAGCSMLLASVLILLSTLHKPTATSNLLSKQPEIIYKVDGETDMFHGSGFLKGSAYFNSSPFVNTPELLRKSALVANRDTPELLRKSAKVAYGDITQDNLSTDDLG